MNRFSTETLVLLHNAGWKEGRYVEIKNYEEVLNNEGFSIHDCVKNLLKEFANLTVIHPHAKVSNEKDYFHFDVSKAVKGRDPYWVKEDYRVRVGKNLCIIGEAFRGYMVLSMSDDGNVYAGFDDILVHVGISGDDAIEALCTGRKLLEIPDYEPD
jgi:hypothetical protein